MRTRATAFGIVPPRAAAPEAPAAARETGSRLGDLLVLAILLAASLVPIVGSAAGGSWSDRTVGAAAALALLAAIQLVRELRATWAR